jgi:hypothetical protein
MPVLQGNQSTSLTIQSLANQLKSQPEFYQVLGGVAGYSEEPLLTICNEIMCRILAENMPWKWNRQIIPPFLTVSLQQDYITNINNIGWLENGWVLDINNSTSNSNGAPKPIRELETVRDMTWTSSQSVPFEVSFIQNSLASLGLWQANTAYGCGYGVATLPRSPIQQFLDNNGNILYIDSTQLGLNITSPGYTGTTIPLPSNAPYGTSGSTQPLAPANATPGSLIQDGSVIWTVADPNAYCLRFNPVPALNGLCWWVVVQSQTAPPQLTSLQDNLSPIPYNMNYLFRAGVRASLKRENGAPDANQQYAEWEETLMKAVRAGDRQAENYILYPESSIMSGSTQPFGWAGIGAANPYGPALLFPGYGS